MTDIESRKTWAGAAQRAARMARHELERELAKTTDVAARAEIEERRRLLDEFLAGRLRAPSADD